MADRKRGINIWLNYRSGTGGKRPDYGARHACITGSRMYIIYAGSLVNEELLEYAKKNVKL